ncbi:hypothetical protein KGF56_000422 [Candida oxycetoniae]|uniref:Protein YTP1-like C-terminal domain-containing protein n=1 Tax=Candida oxycetoniae TaxID=497107 RepID=A0AAI9WZX2_9ASCO|nr:uncharacterized protein KGF56_000422 [Candida oxycetoniae]KAI3406817.2 hypothetical protein KGF56_000422 [Candida oxycetoniae]
MKASSLLLLFCIAIPSIAMSMDEMEPSDVLESASTHSHNDNNSGNGNGNGDGDNLVPIAHVMKHQHGVPILETNLLPEERLYWENYNTTTYFTVESKHRSALYSHIIVGLFTIIFMYPLSLIFNNLNMSKTYLAVLALHTTAIMISLMCYSIFINSIPNLYPGNAYNKMLIILFVTTILQAVFALVTNLEPAAKGSITSATTTATTNSTTNNGSSLGRYFSLRSSTSASDVEDTVSESSSLSSTGAAEAEAINFEKLNMIIPESKFYQFRKWIAQTRFHKSFKVGFNILNWGHFFYYLVLVPTGVATFCIYGEGKKVFNLLAHFIKGGVFFAYGILTLGRYCGAFANKGWAWNHKFVDANRITNPKKLGYWERFQNKGLWTMEMVESSLILFYGSTNIFLEHLSNAGGEWSPKDLQHVSIAFIFIGCGLCGVITELKLQDWRFEQAVSNYKKVIAVKKAENEEEVNTCTSAVVSSTAGATHEHQQQLTPGVYQNIIKASPGFSPNPFPVLTIYWTGILMSQHQQASELSTEIHVQWGNLFVFGCAFRFLTYLLMLLTSSKTTVLTRPSRPITELIVAFSLICGGLIFMESTDPVVLSFEYYGLTSMFTLNVSLGVVTLVMSWIMVLFTFKDCLKGRFRQAVKEIV